MLSRHASLFFFAAFTSLSVACVDTTDPLDDRRSPSQEPPAAPPAATGTGTVAKPEVPPDPSCEAASLVRLDPTTWARAGSNASAYTMETDATLTFCDRVGIHMRSKPGAAADKFGTFMGTSPATPYASKRVRLRATVRAAGVTGWASMWLRIDGADGKMIVLDNMKERSLQGTLGARTASIVLDVPANAATLAYGAMLSGAGEIWANDIVLETVGAEVPTTR